MICIYIDMAKAFNSLNCDQLWNKLKELGIDGNVLNLFREYLTSRQQLTNLGGKLSDTSTINYGVPQGSLLGPTLFYILMNDLPSIFSIRENVRRRYSSKTSTYPVTLSRKCSC